MPARWSRPRRLRRLPFGIGTVAAILTVAMIVTAGVVLSAGASSTASREFTGGRLRDYSDSPRVAWTVSSDTLPGYRGSGGITVEATWRDRWLLAYPSGLGRATILVDRRTGKPLWDKPVVVGLGGCGMTAAGLVGCAVRLGGIPDGFYLIDNTGHATSRTGLDGTARVVGVGFNLLRTDSSGYRVTLRNTAGKQIWSRTFSAAATARSTPDGTLVIATTDGRRFLIDPRTGADRLSCAECTISTFASGVTMQYTEFGRERVETYRVADGQADPRRVMVAPGMTVLDGPAMLPVLASAEDASVGMTQGRYEIRDPARTKALWQISDPELSKANTKPCGTMVAFALKDRSRVVYSLADGRKIGRLAPPRVDDPDSDIDQLTCIGSSGTTLVFADANQVTAFDVAHSRIAWQRPTIGSADSVDGFIVLHEGTSMTVLAPR